jgi:hypothetical protein
MTDKSLVPIPEMLDPDTGEVMIVPDGEHLEMWETFTSAACTPDETKALNESFDPVSEWDILPTGEVYVNHMRYRARLTAVFGAAGWGMRPLEPMKLDAETGTGYQRWAMFARGQVIGVAVGSARYNDSNKRMDYADTAEAIKSNALTRICKDMAMGADLYDKRNQDTFRETMAVRVWRKETNKPQWRRRDAPPWWDETGEVSDIGRAATPTATPAATPTARAETTANEPTSLQFRSAVQGATTAKTGATKTGKKWTLGQINFTTDARTFWTFDTKVLALAEQAAGEDKEFIVTVEEKMSSQGRRNWHVKSMIDADDDLGF